VLFLEETSNSDALKEEGVNPKKYIGTLKLGSLKISLLTA